MQKNCAIWSHTDYHFKKKQHCYRVKSVFKCLHGQLFRRLGVTALRQPLVDAHTKGHREFANIRRVNKTNSDRDGDEVTASCSCDL